jgi:hypothetical protein
MIRKAVLGVMMLASAALAASPASATIISLTVNGGFGLDTARMCSSTSCLSTIWTNNSNYATTGTITIDDVALTLNATLSVSFSEITGAANNGITEIEFHNTTYTISAPITVIAGTPTTYQIAAVAGASNWATVDPTTFTQVGTGGGSTDPIWNNVRVTGSCGLVAGNVGQCGFTFGATNFPISLGTPAVTRGVQQTFNLAVVPEPTTISLLAAGIIGLGWAGRRRV